MDKVNVAVATPQANMGDPILRTESIAKVTGAPVYAADTPRVEPLQAYLLRIVIVRGHVTLLDIKHAEAMKGVVKVYTHPNAPRRTATPYTQKGGYVSDTNMPLIGPEINNDGQIIAMIIAESYEIARDASHRIVVQYETLTPAATMESSGAETVHPDALDEKEKKVREFDTAYASAPVTVDGIYSTPAQHQNAIELVLYDGNLVWRQADNRRCCRGGG